MPATQVSFSWSEGEDEGDDSPQGESEVRQMCQVVTRYIYSRPATVCDESTRMGQPHTSDISDTLAAFHAKVQLNTLAA